MSKPLFLEWFNEVIKAHITWAQIPRLVDARTCVVANQPGILRRLLVKDEDVSSTVLPQRLVNQIATANKSTRRSPHKGPSSHCSLMCFPLQKRTLLANGMTGI